MNNMIFELGVATLITLGGGPYRGEGGKKPFGVWEDCH